MSVDLFKSRLEQGKPLDHTYSSAGREGLISVWRVGGRYVVTWEESEPGDELDESRYSRDDRVEFETPEQVIEYLSRSAVSLDSW